MSAFSQVVSLNVRSLQPLPPSTEGEAAPVLPPISLRSYILKINSLLPSEIRIYAAAEVSKEFSARFSCTERKYKYFFLRSSLDVERMRVAAQLLVGSHDFRNFCKIDAANVLSFVREIRGADIEAVQTGSEENERQLCAFVLRGSGFLWHQVRCIVAVLFMVGKGQEDPDVITRMLDVGTFPRKPIYHMAPEQPLVLWDCDFGDLSFVYDDVVVHKVTQLLQTQWEELTIKSTIMRHMLDTLQPSVSDTVEAPSRKRKYVPLLERPLGPSVEELVGNLSSKRQKLYQAKRQRVEEYDAKKDA